MYLIKYSNILLFVDDTNILKTIKYEIDALQLQSDLSHFQEWYNINGICLNANKCVVIFFT